MKFWWSDKLYHDEVLFICFNSSWSFDLLINFYHDEVFNLWSFQLMKFMVMMKFWSSDKVLIIMNISTHENGNLWCFLPVWLHQQPFPKKETYEVFCMCGFIRDHLQQWKLVKFLACVASSATIRNDGNL